MRPLLTLFLVAIIAVASGVNVLAQTADPSAGAAAAGTAAGSGATAAGTASATTEEKALNSKTGEECKEGDSGCVWCKPAPFKDEEEKKKVKAESPACYDLRIQWGQKADDESKLEEVGSGDNTTNTDTDQGKLEDGASAVGTGQSGTGASGVGTGQTSTPCELTDNDCVNSPEHNAPEYKPGASAQAYGCTDNDCQNAQAGLYDKPFDPAQAPMNTDASYKCVVTTCDRTAWSDAGALDQKRLLEEGADKYFKGVDTSNYKFNQITPEEASKYGKIDPEYKTPAFAKMMDEHIAPDLWQSASLEQKQLLATNYLTNVTGRYTPNQAAGIVGNLTAESGMNPYLNAKGSENSSGLAQWNGARAAGRRQQALEDYAGKQFGSVSRDSKGNEIHNGGPGAVTQLAYVDAEMQGYAKNPDAGALRTGRAFASNPNMSVAQATQTFGQHYERPADLSASINKRQNAAQTALGNFMAANGGSISGGGTPPAVVSAGSNPVERTVARTLNAGLSPQGISTPPSTLSNLGTSLGSSLSGPQGLQGLQSNNVPTSGLSNLLGSLFGVQPSSSGSTPNTPTQSPATTAHTRLTTLLTQQQQQLSQFSATSQTSGADLGKLKTLLSQHQSQLRQFAIQYPAADQNYLTSLDTLLSQQITQIAQLEKQSTNTAGGSYAQQLQRLVAEQLDQQQAVINTQGQVVTNATPGTLNTSVQSDLTVTALKANSTLSDEYRFRGSLSRTLKNNTDHLAFSEVGSYFGSDVEHELLLDLTCDGTINDRVSFKTPYYSILPRADGADVLLSEYLTVTEEGLHCFAFKVDVNNDIPETNETNNTSTWREFIVGFGGSAADTSLPPLNFEVSAYTTRYANVTQNWTSEDITISAGQEIAFRWDAPQYQQCIPLLSSLTPDFASNLVPIERNTLSEGIDLHEHTGYYELRCSIDGNTRVETVWVGVE